ncbi:MAG: dockerin type I domain-containing protein [Planctomycetota bacterium]
MKSKFIGMTIVVGLFSWSAIEVVEAQDDFLITRPFANIVEQFDGLTGNYLGPFVTAGDGGLVRPGAVAVGPDQNVYVTSLLTGQVLRYDGISGEFIDVFAEGNGISTPNNLVFNGDYLYVGDFSGGASGFLRRFDAATGAFVDEFADVDFTDGIEFTSDAVYVSNFNVGVLKFDLQDGSFIENFIPSGHGGLLSPTALLFLDNGDLLVSSYNTNSVKRYSPNGDYIDDVITDLFQPEGLAIGLDGNLYAGSYGLGIVNKYDANTFEFIEEFANLGPVTNFFTFRSELLLGDVNSDGIVSLLDIAPFVDLINNGGFQLEADINKDGVVDLLDVSPLVLLLSRG